jgi:hypothetical protein
MADKMRQINVLLQSLSRLPGLGFLAQAEYRLQDAVDAVDDVNDQIEDNQRYIEDAGRAVKDIATVEEEAAPDEEVEEEVAEEE